MIISPDIAKYVVTGIPTQADYNFTSTPRITLHWKLTTSGMVFLRVFTCVTLERWNSAMQRPKLLWFLSWKFPKKIV